MKILLLTAVIIKYYILNFRMAQTLHATCDFEGYLFCNMPADTLEVEVKIKMKWGSTQCLKILIPMLKSTVPGIEQIGEARHIPEGGEHPKGKLM